MKYIKTIKNYNFFKGSEDYILPIPKSDVGNDNTSNIYMELTGSDLAKSIYEKYPTIKAASIKINLTNSEKDVYQNWNLYKKMDAEDKNNQVSRLVFSKELFTWTSILLIM